MQATAIGSTVTIWVRHVWDFAKLERDYGVRHLDAEPRNITYSDKLGCFCIIDFELAEILPPPPGMSVPPASPTP